MIPKIIHYCWFGKDEKPKLAKKCIASWKKYCPDYQIIEWNEDNYDISSAPLFVRQAIEAQKWAFASDYVRLKVVYEHGGIYLDTDVEMIKNFDVFLHNPAFFGFEYALNSYRIATGLGFGAEKGCSILLEIMKIYEDNAFYDPSGDLDMTWNTTKETSVFLKHGIQLDGSEQIVDDGIHIYPAQYFQPLKNGFIIPCLTSKTVSIHWYASSWWPEGKRRENIKRTCKDYIKHIPNRLGMKILGMERYNRLKRIFGNKSHKAR